MKLVQILSSALLAILITSCSSIEMPKGKQSRGNYQSARLVKTRSGVGASDTARVTNANTSVHQAIESQFKSHNLAFGNPNAELIVAYMLIGQTNGATTMNIDYFGSGRDPQAILDEAHQRGAIDNKRPDAFKSGALVVDIIDARTNKLVFRNFTRRDILEGAQPSQQDARIKAAVAEVLAPFFR